MPNLALLANEPLTEIGLYSRDFLDDLTDNHEGYTHTISAVNGYDTANFTLKGNKEYLDDWFNDGLMRRILFTNPEGIVVWEGFVNRINYTIGTLQRTKTIETMFNRIYLTYSPKDTSVFPPLVLPPTTIIVDDLDSQAQWGVKATVVKGSELTDEEAFAWASFGLDNSKEVLIGETVNTLSTSLPTIKLECKGYIHTLKWLPYINENTTGQIQAHQVIQEVLLFFDAVNPTWVSTNFGLMDYNFRLEARAADEFRTCYDIIKGIITRGGLAGERWVGGVYQERIFDYKPAEDFSKLYSEFHVLRRAVGTDDNVRIFDEEMGTEIKPWDMLPERILKTVDI